LTFTIYKREEGKEGKIKLAKAKAKANNKMIK